MQKLTHVIQKVSEWAGKHPHLTSAIIDTTLAVAGLTTALGILLTTISTGLIGIATGRLLLRLAGIGSSAEKAGSALSGLGRTMGLLRGAGGGLLRLLILIGGGLFSIPGALIVAGAGLSWAIVHWWDDLTGFWHRLKGALSDAATNGGLLKASFSQFALDCVAPFESLYNIIDSLVKRTEDWIGLSNSDAPKLLKDKVNNLQADLQAAKLPGILQDKVNTLAGDLKGALNAGKKSGGDKPFGKDVWNPKGAGSSGTSLTDPNKLGDIVFKHVPDWIRIGGGYQEPRLYKSGGGGLLSDLRQVAVNTIGSFIPSASQQPAPASTVGTSVAGDMVVTFHIHDATNPQAVAKEVRHVLDELNRKNARAARSTYHDRE